MEYNNLLIKINSQIKKKNLLINKYNNQIKELVLIENQLGGTTDYTKLVSDVKNAAETLNNFKGKIEPYIQNLKLVVEQTKNSLKDINDKNVILNRDIEELKSKLNACDTEKNRLINELKVATENHDKNNQELIRKQNEEINRLKNDHSLSSEQKIAELEKLNTKAIEQLKEESKHLLEEKNRLIDSLQHENTTLKENNSKLTEKTRENAGTISTLEKHLSDLEPALKALVATVGNVTKDVTSISSS